MVLSENEIEEEHGPNLDERTAATLSCLNLDRINYDLIVELLNYIDDQEDFRQIRGSVLVFLPGMVHVTVYVLSKLFLCPFEGRNM